MSDLPRPSQRRLEFQARKIEQLELVIASQSDLISLLRSQLHIHSESTLLLQRGLHPFLRRHRRHSERHAIPAVSRDYTRRR